MRKDEQGEKTGAVFVCLDGGGATPLEWNAGNGACLPIHGFPSPPSARRKKPSGQKKNLTFALHLCMIEFLYRLGQA